MSREQKMQKAAGAMNEESSRTTDGRTRMLDASDSEDDMHKHLDDQINKITMITESFKEISPSMMHPGADADTSTPRTRRSLRSRSRSAQHGGQTEMSLNSKSKLALSLDKNPRLSPLAARAALAAAVLLKPIPQVKGPSLLASETVQSNSSHNRPESRSTTVTVKRETRKTRKEPKTPEITRRITTRGYHKQKLQSTIDA